MVCHHAKKSQAKFESSTSSYDRDRTAYAKCNCQLVQPYANFWRDIEANVLETTYTRVTGRALGGRKRFKTSSPSPVPLSSWSGQKTRRVRGFVPQGKYPLAMSQILETLIDGLPSCEKITGKV